MIKFLVTGQQLQIVTPLVVADTHNYQSATGTFRGEQWQPCTKWVHFLKDDAEYIKAMHNNMIRPEDGLDLNAGTWAVYIHGDEYDPETDTITTRITTGTALMKVESAEKEKPFPGVEQAFADTLAGEVETAWNIAENVRKDAAAGLFDGATFTPDVSANGELSWSNDKGLKNPETINIKGEPGRDGLDFTVRGYFESLEALEAAVQTPYVGEAYGVGTAEPFDVYVWDGINSVWVNNGPVQGAKGDPGVTPTVKIISVEMVESDQPATVVNVGSETDVQLKIQIPKGYTPQKGVDYWTADDQKSIGENIQPSTIGAIAVPKAASSGQYLMFDGSAWMASTVAAGVSSVNGKTGEVITQLEFQNVNVPASAYVKQASPKYAEFPYVASIPLTGVTTNHSPDVRFSGDDATSQKYHVVSESYSGGIYIYSTGAATLTIPAIVMNDVGKHLLGTTNSTAVAKGSVTYYFEIEVPASWTEADGQFSQTIAVDGILATDKPKVDIVLSDTAETAEAQEEAYACVRKIKTADGSIAIVCREEPETAFTVQLEVNRK